MGVRSLGLGVLLLVWVLAAGCSDDGAASAVASDDVALPACGALPATALRKVADGVSRAAYGRCGHLAYVESGRSKAVHLLDPALDRDTVVGSTDGTVQFSPLGSRLFFHEQGSQKRLVVVDVDALGSGTFDVEDALYGFVSLESAPGGEQMWRCSASQGLVLVDGAGETTVLDGEAGACLLVALDARGRLSTWIDGQRNAIDGLNSEADHVARIWPDGSALVFESLDEPLRRTPQNARFRLLGADGAVKASLEADRFHTVTIVGQEGAVVAFEREGFEVIEGESTVSVRLVALERIATDGGAVSSIAQRAVSRSLMTGPAQRVLFRADEDGDEVVGLWAGDLP